MSKLASLKEIPSIAKPFYLYTKGQIFTADTLRASPYSKYIEPVHGFGAFFASLKLNGLAEYLGETRSVVESNKGRKIDCFRWSLKAEQLFEEAKK